MPKTRSIDQVISTQYWLDRQTNRWTTHDDSIYRAGIASRGKNHSGHLPPGPKPHRNITLNPNRYVSVITVTLQSQTLIHNPNLDPSNPNSNHNKAVIDRRLRPRCCHLGSYFKRPRSRPVRPFACNWYYCAHFTAKPKAACALRFSWAATSSNLGL